MKILVIHGPNLNLLGKREPHIYGAFTLDEINAELIALGKELGAEVTCYQSNSEGDIVQKVQDIMGTHQAIVINPGAYTHTSIAIRDAISASGIPTVETHISNIYTREDFRKHSYISAVAAGQITGFGKDSYLLALRAAVGVVRSKSERRTA
jgi:3-dehydroquinate dehydratase-2